MLGAGVEFLGAYMEKENVNATKTASIGHERY
jgi:hypothetical protein